jgi:tRNA(Ser,Leu) C12 N-acetylase TAN1
MYIKNAYSWDLHDIAMQTGKEKDTQKPWLRDKIKQIDVLCKFSYIPVIQKVLFISLIYNSLWFLHT